MLPSMMPQRVPFKCGEPELAVRLKGDARGARGSSCGSERLELVYMPENRSPDRIRKPDILQNAAACLTGVLRRIGNALDGLGVSLSHQRKAQQQEERGWSHAT
jgi:hypothetical protein